MGRFVDQPRKEAGLERAAKRQVDVQVPAGARHFVAAAENRGDVLDDGSRNGAGAVVDAPAIEARPC